MSASEKMAAQRAMNKELNKLVPETLKGFMALEHGATREELGDVCAMAMTMGGGPALMYAARALAAWDELSAA